VHRHTHAYRHITNAAGHATHTSSDFYAVPEGDQLFTQQCERKLAASYLLQTLMAAAGRQRRAARQIHRRDRWRLCVPPPPAPTSISSAPSVEPSLAVSAAEAGFHLSSDH